MENPRNLLYLNYFVEIINHQSISKAAQALFVSQPALSKIIAKLEKDLGITLLKRTNKGVFPTAEGEKIYKDILKINSIIDSWYTAKLGEDPHGEISINLTPGLRLHFILNLMIPFCNKYPNIKIYVNDTRPPHALQDLCEKQANICITTFQCQIETMLQQAESLNITMEKLFVDERKVFIGAKHPLAQGEYLSVEELSKIPMAYYSSEKNMQTPYDKYFPSLYYLQSLNEVLELIANNQAVAILPSKINKFEPAIKQNLIKTFPVPFPDTNLKAPVYVCYTEKISPVEKLLLDFIKENFAKALA